MAEMARAHPKGEWELKMATLESVYGRHAAMHARMEAAIVAQPLGAGSLAGTDAFGLDTLLGNQMRFGTADAFGNPFEQPEMPFDAVDVHTAAEIASAAAHLDDMAVCEALGDALPVVFSNARRLLLSNI